jgi:hypothetical protein
MVWQGGEPGRGAPWCSHSGPSRGRIHGCTPNAGPAGIKRGGRARLRRFVPRVFEHEDSVMSQKKSAIDKKASTSWLMIPMTPTLLARRRG